MPFNPEKRREFMRAGLLGGIGQGLSCLGGGAPSSMPKGYNPNSLSGLY
jgi:hypothetical protein